MAILNEWDSKQLLGESLPRPVERLTVTLAEAIEFTSATSGPVVAKASGVAHKTEGGLVRLGLDADGVADCWDELAAAGDGRVLVAQHVRGDLELMVGGLRDPQFGPVISIGLGGVAAEVFGDVVFVLAPPEPGEVAAAIATLQTAPLLGAHRGRTATDVDALIAIVDAVAGLLEREPSVVEIDCNPVLVVQGRPVVVDALVVIDGPMTDDREATAR